MTVEQAIAIARWKRQPYTPTEEASVVLADEVERLRVENEQLKCANKYDHGAANFHRDMAAYRTAILSLGIDLFRDESGVILEPELMGGKLRDIVNQLRTEGESRKRFADTAVRVGQAWEDKCDRLTADNEVLRASLTQARAERDDLREDLSQIGMAVDANGKKLGEIVGEAERTANEVKSELCSLRAERFALTFSLSQALAERDGLQESKTAVANDCLAALAGVVCTPLEGYVSAGMGWIYSDIRSLVKLYKESQTVVERLREALEQIADDKCCADLVDCKYVARKVLEEVVHG